MDKYLEDIQTGIFENEKIKNSKALSIIEKINTRKDLKDLEIRVSRFGDGISITKLVDGGRGYESQDIDHIEISPPDEKLAKKYSKMFKKEVEWYTP